MNIILNKVKIGRGNRDKYEQEQLKLPGPRAEYDKRLRAFCYLLGNRLYLMSQKKSDVTSQIEPLTSQTFYFIRLYVKERNPQNHWGQKLFSFYVISQLHTHERKIITFIYYSSTAKNITISSRPRVRLPRMIINIITLCAMH